MKTSKYLKTIAICAVMLAAALPGKAQVFPNTYINVDWQVGVPLGADFADKTSGHELRRRLLRDAGYHRGSVHLLPDQPAKHFAPDARPGRRLGQR